MTCLTRSLLTLGLMGLLFGCSSAGGQGTSSAVTAPGSETTTSGSAIAPASPPQATDTPDTPPASPVATAAKTLELAPGRYCYQLESDTLSANVRLTLASNQQISGDARGTIHDQSNSYYSSYTEQFSGVLTADQAKLNITTWIEYDVQENQETWVLTAQTLQIHQDVFNLTDCQQVDPAFQDLNGLEAKDLLENAVIARTERLAFAPGTSTATVNHGVIRGERDVYTLAAEGGQEMTLSITSLEDNAVFDVISPSGYILTMEAVQETIFLPHNGDYQVIVGGTRGNAAYDLTIGIQ